MININSASVEDLQKIIHIGPVRAQIIVDHRPYRDVYEISRVLGIGTVRLKEILEQGIRV